MPGSGSAQAQLGDTETLPVRLSGFPSFFSFFALAPPHPPPPLNPLAICLHPDFMSWSPEECRGQREPLGDKHALCARLVEKPSRGSTEHPESGQGPIVTRTASGPALAFWRAVLAGDVGCVSHLLADSSAGLAPDSVFDTSDPERWRDFRFNIRALSTGRGPGGPARDGGGWAWSPPSAVPSSSLPPSRV